MSTPTPFSHYKVRRPTDGMVWKTLTRNDRETVFQGRTFWAVRCDAAQGWTVYEIGEGDRLIDYSIGWSTRGLSLAVREMCGVQS
jgi:hypothetical protein